MLMWSIFTCSACSVMAGFTTGRPVCVLGVDVQSIRVRHRDGHGDARASTLRNGGEGEERRHVCIGMGKRNIAPGGKEKSVGEGKGTTSWLVPLKGRTRGKVGKAAKLAWSS